MLTHPTLDQLKALKLDGMADAFVELQAQDSSDELGHAEWLSRHSAPKVSYLRLPASPANSQIGTVPPS